jgi:hypothetical protein
MEWEQFTNELQTLGYFRYIREERKPRIPKMLEQLKKKPSIYTVGVNRDFPASEQRLTKCSVKNFLKEVRPVLKANGVDVTQRQIVEDCSREGYRIHVKGKSYQIYSAEELEREDRKSFTTVHDWLKSISFRKLEPDHLWSISGRRTFAMINDLLKNAGAEERIYSLYGGNDHWAWFFSEKLYSLLADADFFHGETLTLYEDLD